jgi:hypothetical protein
MLLIQSRSVPVELVELAAVAERLVVIHHSLVALFLLHQQVAVVALTTLLELRAVQAAVLLTTQTLALELLIKVTVVVVELLAGEQVIQAAVVVVLVLLVQMLHPVVAVMVETAYKFLLLLLQPQQV